MRTLGSNVFVLLLAGLALSPTGCTVALWNSPTTSFCEPAPDPNLALFEAGPHSDILVEYSAISDKHDNVLRLAYFSNANQKRIAAGKSPHFTSPKRSLKMQAIPIAGLQPISHPLALTNSYATVTTNRQAFTLFRPGCQPENYALPFYRDDYSTLRRVALTPVALTVDATIIGAFAALIWAGDGNVSSYGNSSGQK
jgi:hypothetical protein